MITVCENCLGGLPIAPQLIVGSYLRPTLGLNVFVAGLHYRLANLS